MNKPIPRLTDADVARFWNQVDKSGNCWLWTGAKVRGYGTVKLRETFYVHRVSYFIANNIDPGALMVCHSCDTSACVNPKHLWLGTCKDNIQDAVAKNRHPHGETSGRVKLIEEDVKAILDSNEGAVTLAERYGISTQVITNIRAGRIWKHLGKPRRKPGSANSNSKTGVRGVYLCNRSGKYIARYKGKYLGLFTNIKDATKTVAKRRDK